MIDIGRRGLIGGAAAFLAMPAIIRTPGLLMPLRRLRLPMLPLRYDFHTEMYTGANVLRSFPGEVIWESPEGPRFRSIMVKLERD